MITGKFLADFESFYTACTKAEASLKNFASGAGTVETSLNKMVDSFSGRKLIQDATLMTEAVNRIGGTSKLTEAELARVGSVAQEAVAKMTALGVYVPQSLEKIANSAKGARTDFDGFGDASERSSGSVRGLGNQLAQVDGVLGAFGIHLGPEVKALRELGDNSGKTASQLGTLGTAALAAGAAFGGWKLGRLIADLAGTDQIIGDSIANLLGWKEAAGGAGSASDTLARASETAGRKIISLAEALKINADAVKEWQGAISRSHAAEDSAKEVAHWRAELQALGTGVLSSLKKDLDSHNFSQAELARRYGVSTEALGLLSRQMQRHQEVMKELEAEQEKFQALQDHLFSRDVTARAQEMSRAIGDVSNAGRLLPPMAAEVNQTMQTAYNAMKQAGLGATDTAKRFYDLAVATTDWAAINAKLAAMPDPFAAQNKARADAYRATLIEQANLNQGITDSQLYWAHAGEIADESMRKAAEAVESVIPVTNEAASNVSNQFTLAFQAVAQSAEDMIAGVRGAMAQTEAYRKAGIFVNPGFGTADTYNHNILRSLGATIPPYADGVMNAPGGMAVVGERGPELVNLPRGSSVIPNGRWGGTTVTVAPGAIVIHGGTAQGGRDAADAFIARLKASGVRV